MAVYRVIERRIYEFEVDGEEQARQMVEQDEGLPVDALRSRLTEAVIEVGQGQATDVGSAALEVRLDERGMVPSITPRIY